VYMAVIGGIQSDEVLGSRCFYPGITQTRLQKGDLLETKPIETEFTEYRSKLRLDQSHFKSVDLHCYPGPEYERLSAKQKEQLKQSFTISEDNNRVGYRMQETLVNDLQPILTSAVLPGTVQLTPSGKLIVLMRDCQVTGGYPRVLQLSDKAVAQLAQKVAGEKVRLKLE